MEGSLTKLKKPVAILKRKFAAPDASVSGAQQVRGFLGHTRKRTSYKCVDLSSSSVHPPSRVRVSCRLTVRACVAEPRRWTPW